MARRAAPVRRTRAEWAVRGGLAALAAVVGVVSLSQTLAQTIRNADPGRAHALAPGDGRITALFAANRFAAAAGAQPASTRAAQAARTALVQDPTAVPAVAVLGLDARLHRDVRSARRLFAYSETLSRRDLQTQLWQIEDTAGRNDVAGALVHFDKALRASRRASDLLFPVLGTAISDPTVRAATIRTLAARPGWGDAFISYVAKGQGDPRIAASLFSGLNRAGTPVFEDAGVAAINALVARGLVAEAWSYYASVHPGADPARSRDPLFTADPGMPSPFDWVAVNDTGISTSFQRGDHGGIFDFMVSTGAGGPLLRQMQMLPAGDYRLAGHAVGLDQSADARPYWLLTCGDGREAGRVIMPDARQANGAFAGRFVVPAGCRAQTLALVARPSGAMGSVTGQIDRVRLEPAR